MMTFAELKAANDAARKRIEALTIAEIDAMPPNERIAAAKIAGRHTNEYLTYMARADGRADEGLGFAGGFFVRYAAEENSDVKIYALDLDLDGRERDVWNDFGASLDAVEGRMRAYFDNNGCRVPEENIAQIMGWFANATASGQGAA